MAVFLALQARDAPAAQAAMHAHLVRQRGALRTVARSQANRIAS